MLSVKHTHMAWFGGRVSHRQRKRGKCRRHSCVTRRPLSNLRICLHWRDSLPLGSEVALATVYATLRAGTEWNITTLFGQVITCPGMLLIQTQLCMLQTGNQ